MGSLSEEVRTEVLCGYICDLEAKYDELLAENAKLRAMLSGTIECGEAPEHDKKGDL